MKRAILLLVLTGAMGSIFIVPVAAQALPGPYYYVKKVKAAAAKNAELTSVAESVIEGKVGLQSVTFKCKKVSSNEMTIENGIFFGEGETKELVMTECTGTAGSGACEVPEKKIVFKNLHSELAYESEPSNVEVEKKEIKAKQVVWFRPSAGKVLWTVTLKGCESVPEAAYNLEGSFATTVSSERNEKNAIGLSASKPNLKKVYRSVLVIICPNMSRRGFGEEAVGLLFDKESAEITSGNNMGLKPVEEFGIFDE